MPAPRRHLVVMVRRARPGRVKRRLARDIGPVAACAFYRRAANAVLGRLSADPRWRLWLSVTPDACARQRADLGGIRAPRAPRLAQGPGDIGARMARAFAALPPGPAVLVGSDIPEVRARHVARAFRLLGAHDAVFGPAEDGGFWLVGLKRPAHAGRLFRGVRWSGPHALADVLANLAAGERAGFVDTLADVDDGPAHARWRARGGRL